MSTETRFDIQMLEKMSEILIKVERINNNTDSLKDSFENRFTGMEKSFEKLEQKVGQIDEQSESADVKATRALEEISKVQLHNKEHFDRLYDKHKAAEKQREADRKADDEERKKEKKESEDRMWKRLGVLMPASITIAVFIANLFIN